MKLLMIPLFFLASFAHAENKLAHGKKVFQANCVACHGLKGDGRGPAAAAIAGAKPRDFTAGVYKYGDSPEQLLKTITDGVDGTAMPTWKSLPEEDRKAVVAYILTLKHK